MPGVMTSEAERVGLPLNTSREPVAPKTPGSKGSVGDMAVMDSVMVVAFAWLVLLFIAFSLRRHNV